MINSIKIQLSLAQEKFQHMMSEIEKVVLTG